MKHYDSLTLATTAHNNKDMSHAMLRSFEQHIGTCKEIVIVDDGSAEIYSAPALHSPVRVIRNEKAIGFCNASDMALQEVQTEFAMLVDADVLFLSGDFDTGFGEFCSDSHWCWVNFVQLDFQGKPQQSFEAELQPAWIFALGNQARVLWNKGHATPLTGAHSKRIADVEVAHSSCAVLRMGAYRAIGGFDHWYWQAESDVDLSLAFRRAHHGVGIDTGYTVMHEGTGGKNDGERRTADLYRARLHLYEKFYPSSRAYLRPLLFCRHLLEVFFFAFVCLFQKCNSARLRLRLNLLKTVLRGY